MTTENEDLNRMDSLAKAIMQTIADHHGVNNQVTSDDVLMVFSALGMTVSFIGGILKAHHKDPDKFNEVWNAWTTLVASKFDGDIFDTCGVCPACKARNEGKPDGR
jgi:hypothetical protein